MRKSTSAGAVQKLQKAHPQATLSECNRFLDAFGKKQAPKFLGEYLAWRDKYCGQGFCEEAKQLDDKAMWERASARALEFHNCQNDIEKNACDDQGWPTTEDESGEESTLNSSTTENDDGASDEEGQPLQEASMTPAMPKQRVSPRHKKEVVVTHQSAAATNLLVQSSSTPTVTGPMPQFVVSHSNGQNDVMRDLKGHVLLQALPAQMDMQFTEEAYTMALAMYLEQLFQDENEEDESSYQKITLMLDVRPGRGWPNDNAMQLVGLIRYVANTLNALHPNRLHKCILFPVPRAAIVLWNLALKPFLDSKLRQVVELVPGTGAMIKSPPPNEKLADFVCMGNLEYMERYRRSTFRSSRRATTFTPTFPSSKSSAQGLNPTSTALPIEGEVPAIVSTSA